MAVFWFFISWRERFHQPSAKWLTVSSLVLGLIGYCNCLATVDNTDQIGQEQAMIYPQHLVLNLSMKNNSNVTTTFGQSYIKNVSLSYSSNKTQKSAVTGVNDKNRINNVKLINNNNNKLENVNINNKHNQLNQPETDGKSSSSSSSSSSDNDLGEIQEIYFGTDNYSVVTSQIGSIAMIPCSVYHISEEMISWIRRKDYHLLTVGPTTYSSDERFSTIHLQHSDDWTLQIKFVQLRDAGIYECQVSTHPPMSIFVQLDVVEARAEISGPSEKYLKPGSTLHLACKVLQSTEPPLYIFWYHNNRMINYDIDRGVNVTTEPDNRYSELVISQTSYIHSGNYSCVPNSAVLASTVVHIFNGENPAAIHHVGHGYPVLSSAPTRLVLLTVIILILIS